MVWPSDKPQSQVREVCKEDVKKKKKSEGRMWGEQSKQKKKTSVYFIDIVPQLVE